MNYYYTTVTEMRWDQLAYLGYGDVSYSPDLIDANPKLPTYDWVPAGVVVTFPYIPSVSSTANMSQMPPWIQAQS